MVAQSSDALAGWYAARRSSTPERLRRMLRGDLDTIVAKAMKKDPSERYVSVTDLADDLRRYLRNEPISARPDTVGYRAAKFVRRNSTVVALAAIAVAASSAGLVGNRAPGKVYARGKGHGRASTVPGREDHQSERGAAYGCGSRPACRSLPYQLLEREERIVEREHYDSAASHIEMLLSIGDQYCRTDQHVGGRFGCCEQAYQLSRGIPESPCAPGLRAC